MTRHRVIVLATAALWALGAGPATAAGSATVDVTATIKEVCTFGGATAMSPIAFGIIDPSAVTGDLIKTGDITYKCTKGTTPTVSLPAAPRTLSDTSTPPNTIAYTLVLGTHEVGTGFSSAAAVTKVVATATIAQAAAQDAKAAAYKETVTLTINY